MRKFSFMMVAAVFAVVIPVTAGASVPTAPCAESSEYARVGLAGVHENVTPALIPDEVLIGDPFSALDYGEESVVRFRYRIDVSGSSAKPSAQMADVRVVLSWDRPSDYDLYVYDANGELLAMSNTGFLQGNVSGPEAIFLPEITHCTDLRVDVVNYLGLPPDEMALDTTLGDLE